LLIGYESINRKKCSLARKYETGVSCYYTTTLKKHIIKSMN
jgi:hypothetical protein